MKNSFILFLLLVSVASAAQVKLPQHQNSLFSTYYHQRATDLHLKGECYLFWKYLVYQYLYNLQEKPSLIPQTQSLQWENGSLQLYTCKSDFN